MWANSVFKFRNSRFYWSSHLAPSFNAPADVRRVVGTPRTTYVGASLQCVAPERSSSSQGGEYTRATGPVVDVIRGVLSVTKIDGVATQFLWAVFSHY